MNLQQLIAEKHYDEAIQLLIKSHKENPNVDDLRVLLALLLETKNFNDLTNYTEKLFELSPHDSAAYFFKGHVLKNQKNLEEALNYFKIAFYINPTNQLPAKAAAQIIEQTGDVVLYQQKYDIALCTGGFFFEKKFNANTINERALGGSESALIYLAKEFKKQGKTVAVFCNCDKPGIYDDIPYESIHEFPFRHALGLFSVVVALRLPDPFLGNLNPKAKQILWLQDDSYTELYRHFDPKHFRIDRIAVLSEFHKSRWQKKYGLPDNIFYITKNGYDPEIFKPHSLKKQQLLFASRPERGLKEAIAVFKNLKEDYPDLTLATCTYTQAKTLEEDPEIQKLEDDLKTPGVHFLGSLPKPEFAKLMRESLILLHPNQQKNIETSCIAAIEAQACGVPVAVGVGGAMAETVQHDLSGLVVSNESSEDLVKHMTQSCQTLLKDKNLYDRLSKGAQDWASSGYQWHQIAKDWQKNLLN